MMVDTETMHTLLHRLQAVPVRIARVVAAFTADEVRVRVASGEWSVLEVFAHIRASDDIVAYRVGAILARDQPPLPAFDERRWAEVKNYANSDVQASLVVFTLQRAELVQVLARIDLADWQRTGLHEMRGLVSLTDIVQGLVEHEEEHCTQIEAYYAG